jgi:hypothetical protein
MIDKKVDGYRCYYNTVCRPSKESFWYLHRPRKEGQGYCPQCKHDPVNNQKCPGYRPIYFGSFKVKD